MGGDSGCGQWMWSLGVISRSSGCDLWVEAVDVVSGWWIYFLPQ